MSLQIQHPQPPQINGAIYPFLDVSYAMSTRDNGGSMALSLVVTLTPYRELDGAVELLPDAAKVFVWGDAMEQAKEDRALLRFLLALHGAGQAFVNEAF